MDRQIIDRQFMERQFLHRQFVDRHFMDRQVMDRQYMADMFWTRDGFVKGSTDSYGHIGYRKPGYAQRVNNDLCVGTAAGHITVGPGGLYRS
jgi:hypothetical protein